MKLCMVKYGQTNWNLEKRRQGWTDTDINDSGTDQAKALHGQLAGRNFTACYTSPLQRAVNTAKILTAGKTPIIESDLLRGRGFGEFEGKLSEEIKPDQDIYDLQLNASVNGIEPIQDVIQRAKDFLDMVSQKYDTDDEILVVTHGIIMRIIKHIIAGDLDQANLESSRFDNASILEVDY